MSKRHQKRWNLSPYGWRVLLLIGATWLRAVSLTAQGLWRDEVDQWRFAQQPWREMFANFTRSGWNGPLYSPLLRGWMTLTGDSVYAMRYLSLLWGLLAVAAFYVLAKRLRGATIACWSAGLLASSPYWIWYGQEIKMYTWMPLLVLLALYALERALMSPTRQGWLVVATATTLAIYSHLLAALLIPVEVSWFFLHQERHPRAWRGGIIVLALLTLPYLPLLRWQMPLLFQVRQTGFPPYTLGEMLGVLFNSWSTGMLSYIPHAGRWQILYQAFFGVTFLIGLIGLAMRRQWHTWSKLIIWLTLPLLILWLISLRGPIFTDRYLIWLSPAFYLFVAQGMHFLSPSRSYFTTLLLSAALLLNGAVDYEQAITPIKPQFNRVATYLTNNRQPDEPLMFQIPYNHYVTEYYLSHQSPPQPLTPWIAAPYTNWRLPNGTYRVGETYVDTQMRTLLGSTSQTWLIYSEVDLWDDRDLVKAWLDAHGTIQRQEQFHGVSVYQYIITKHP